MPASNIGPEKLGLVCDFGGPLKNRTKNPERVYASAIHRESAAENDDSGPYHFQGREFPLNREPSRSATRGRRYHYPLAVYLKTAAASIVAVAAELRIWRGFKRV